MQWLWDEHAATIFLASRDKGGLPLGFFTLLAAADWNAKVNRGGAAKEEETNVTTTTTKVPNFNLSAPEKMAAGEIVKGQPSFVDPNDNLVPPHNFVMECDFDAVMTKLEAKLLGASSDHSITGHVLSAKHQVALEAAEESTIEQDNNKKKHPLLMTPKILAWRTHPFPSIRACFPIYTWVGVMRNVHIPNARYSKCAFFPCY